MHFNRWQRNMLNKNAYIHTRVSMADKRGLTDNNRMHMYVRYEIRKNQAASMLEAWYIPGMFDKVL